MYKVFFNKNCITFTDKFPQGKELVFNKDTLITMLPTLIDNLREDEMVEINAFDTDIKEMFNNFRQHFRLIEAGGGIVENQNGDFVIIQRNGIYDLPKGKKEPDETIETTAQREVMEEVGLSDISLDKFIDHSYHIYKINDEWVLKKTSWYILKTNDVGNLTPQIIEGITEAIWIKPTEITQYIENIYPLILDVFQKYLDIKTAELSIGDF